MTKHLSLLGTAALLAGCFTSAHAAAGVLTCTAASKQIQVNVGFFEFGAVQTPATSTSASTVTYPVLNVHAALSQFGPLFESVNRKIQSCDLRATLNDGSVAEFTFKDVTLDSVTAIARAPRRATDAPARYTNATFHYNTLKVVSAGGSDDGGTDGGWYTPVGTGPAAGGSSQ